MMWDMIAGQARRSLQVGAREHIFWRASSLMDQLALHTWQGAAPPVKKEHGIL
jgi:hypothetical protein